MNKRLSVAITGGIGSGKSLVLNILKEWGYSTFSCDEIYKELSFNKDYLEKLKAVFPFAVNDLGALNREALSQVVFNNKNELKKLNALAHPLVFQNLRKKIDDANGVVFSEVPLLFESGAEKDFDYVIIVNRDKDKRILAVSQRDFLSKEKVENRILSQFNYEKKLKKFLNNEKFFILENNGDIDGVKVEIKKIIDKIMQHETFIVKHL